MTLHTFFQLLVTLSSCNNLEQFTDWFFGVLTDWFFGVLTDWFFGVHQAKKHLVNPSTG